MAKNKIKKYDWNLAIASAIIVGLGQILKGKAEKGILFLLWYYAGFPLLIYFSLEIGTLTFIPMITFCVIFYPVFWLYNIYDAGKTRK